MVQASAPIVHKVLQERLHRAIAADLHTMPFYRREGHSQWKTWKLEAIWMSHAKLPRDLAPSCAVDTAPNRTTASRGRRRKSPGPRGFAASASLSRRKKAAVTCNGLQLQDARHRSFIRYQGMFSSRSVHVVGKGENPMRLSHETWGSNMHYDGMVKKCSQKVSEMEIERGIFEDWREDSALRV